MAKLTDDPKLDGVKVRQELRIGSPYHGMNTIISEKKVDLVVMGTSGRSELGANDYWIQYREGCSYGALPCTHYA